MRRVAQSAAFVALAVAIACSSDYWLGGTRGHLRARDAGSESRAGDGELAPGSSESGADADARVLAADIVLTGDDSLDVSAGDAGACRLIGNGHSIRSEGTWTGHLSIVGCTVDDLGSASTRAISLEMSGAASTTIDGVTFGTSGAIHLTNDDDSTTTFRNNVIGASSTVALDPSADVSTPAFYADGTGTAAKLFQGNRIYRSSAWFQSANWLIGGSQDSDSNIIVGLRAGIVLSASGLVARGNYIHGIHFAGAGDEASVTTIYGTTDALLEHNVLRGGTWVLRGFGGELRYNAVLDAEVSAWLYQPFENTKVHHNLFLMCHPPRDDIQAGVYLVNARAAGIEVYNNTLDAGGPSMRLSGAAIAIDDGCVLSSLRSNAIFGFPLERNDDGLAAVRPGILESVDPPPPRLGYADYNLFYNAPQSGAPRNYAVSVPGHTVRVDAGFGAHDAHAGGPVDEQVDPGPLGLAGGCFPWSDDDIEAGKVTVSQMLLALRGGYTPSPTSALVMSGDPADGPMSPIGAIGGAAPDDLFGTFGR